MSVPTPRKGMGRMRSWEPVDLTRVGDKLSRRRLSDEDRTRVEQEAAEAIRQAKTARALGKALGKILNSVAARYGA